MLEQSWKIYRGWAARARQQQSTTRLWNRIALALVVITSILGTLSSQLDKESDWLKWITVVSALATAVSGWLGREALALESESRWVKARGFAEAIKSECFRFAGRAGAYAGGGDQAETAFSDRIFALRDEIRDLGLVPGDPTPPEGGSKPPPADMTREWYLENRLNEQRRYFEKTLAGSTRKILHYRLIALGSMLLAALCSAAASFTEIPIAPWTGVVTTVAAAFIAAGMNERAQGIAASAARTITHIDDISIRQGRWSLPELVERTEDALQDENLQWRETMRKTRAALAAPKGGDKPGAGPPPPNKPAEQPPKIGGS